LVVNYVYWPVIDDDFIKVDEVVMEFVKAHLQSRPIQDRDTSKDFSRQ
jgi:hypothetical protein